MHVLVIPWGHYRVAAAPLAGIFPSHQVAALQAGGVKVGVVSGGVITTRYLGRPFPYSVHEQLDGVPVFRRYRRVYLPARWEDPLKAAAKSYTTVAPVIERYVGTYGKPDVIHAHNMVTGGLLARWAAAELDVPYVVTEHAGAYSRSGAFALSAARTLARAQNSPSAVIAVGSELAAHLTNGLPHGAPFPILVVPNVIDPGFLKLPLASRRGHPCTIVGLGNLRREKNFALLLTAFSRADLPADSRLVIGGAGPEASRLARLADALGIANRVTFPGRLTRDQVVELLLSADIFAHPSDSETFGVVLIEALACGVPVLATSSGGARDIVSADAGMLTPVGDVGRFAVALGELYRRREHFDSMALRASCLSRFGPKAFVQRMLPIYEQAVG